MKLYFAKLQINLRYPIVLHANICNLFNYCQFQLSQVIRLLARYALRL